METDEITNNADTLNREQTQRPWVTPTFEKEELKKAMSGSGIMSADGVTGYS